MMYVQVCVAIAGGRQCLISFHRKSIKDSSQGSFVLFLKLKKHIVFEQELQKAVESLAHVRVDIV